MGDAAHSLATWRKMWPAGPVLWNTVYLGRAFDVVRRRGDVLPVELLAHLAPLGWQHINLTGD